MTKEEIKEKLLGYAHVCKMMRDNNNVSKLIEAYFTEEPINEKELDKLANDEAQLYSVVKSTEWEEGFKAGYRKAKEL